MRKHLTFFITLGVVLSATLVFAAPTSTIVQNLFITGLKSSGNPMLRIDSNGLVSTTTISGVSATTTYLLPLINSTNVIHVATATTNTNGILTATDWNTFNNKQSGTVNGHTLFGGGFPTLGSCGTGSLVATSSVDNSGTIQPQGVTLSCVLNFATAFITLPSCTVSDNSTALTGDVSSLSTSSVTFGFSASVGGGQVYYHCF